MKGRRQKKAAPNLFAGSENEGVFVSSNNGLNWRKPANSGLPSGTVVSSLAVSGANVFAGIGLGAEWGSRPGHGVFVSNDNGESWQPANSSIEKMPVTSLAVMGSSLFAGTDGNGVFPSTNNGQSWAPSVVQRGDKFVMYYTARYIAAGRQCIDRAISDRPEGPYVDNSAIPFVCQTNLGGSIDPSPFLDSDGKLYLLWKSDGNARDLPVGIWIQWLSDDGLNLSGQPTELLRYDQAWETPLIEGPSMLKEGGRYFLFYSANGYESEDYAIGYATSQTITGPFTKPQNSPIFTKNVVAKGPGGQEFFTDVGGRRWMAYHAWKPGAVGYRFGGSRSFRIESVSFQDSKPVIPGPTLGGASNR